jgi:adenine-specific DNA methylase
MPRPAPLCANGRRRAQGRESGAECAEQNDDVETVKFDIWGCRRRKPGASSAKAVTGVFAWDYRRHRVRRERQLAVPELAAFPEIRRRAN